MAESWTSQLRLRKLHLSLGLRLGFTLIYYNYLWKYIYLYTSIIFSAVETVSSKANTGPKIQAIPCSNPSDCKDIDGTYCDADIQMCLCKPDYPVTDTKQCYKGEKREWHLGISSSPKYIICFHPHWHEKYDVLGAQSRISNSKGWDCSPSSLGGKIWET